MGEAHRQDLRERVIAAMDGDGEAYKLAPLFRVSVSYIYKVLGRRRSTGETTARRWAGGAKAQAGRAGRSAVPARGRSARRHAGRAPGMALERARGDSEHWLPVEAAAASRSDARKSARAAEQDRPDVARARQEWRAGQAELNRASLVFIDETGAAAARAASASMPPCRTAIGTPPPSSLPYARMAFERPACSTAR